MPSPRFERLPPERRAQILDVATSHIAREGPAAASYNQIIAAAGISKTSAYLYFDGKEDLIGEVFRALGARLSERLGGWRPAPSARAFWTRLRATSQALQGYLVEHPDDLALLGHLPPDATPLDGDSWLAAVVENGQALGVIRRDVELPLLTSATRAVLRVGDAHVLGAMLQGEAADDAPVWALLRGMWRPPTSRGGSR